MHAGAARVLRPRALAGAQVWRASESVFVVRAPAVPPGKPHAFGIRCEGADVADAVAAAVKRALDAQRDTVGIPSELSLLALRGCLGLERYGSYRVPKP